jgi:hypothetical protein
MKKYVVLAASLSVLGFASAHAQTFPSPTKDNSAKITQIGNFHEATIDQAVGGELNGQNQAEITQRANRNEAVINQSNATSPMTNSRFANEAEVLQTRARNDAAIDQIHDYARVNRNLAAITQQGTDGDATIQQRGDANTARIVQRNTSAAPIARVEQNGRTNIARVEQFEGSSGEVTVYQGFFGNGTLTSPQTFTSNVNVLQSGENANIFISQIGTSHVATVDEDGTNGMIDVRMEGALNRANIEQVSQNGLIMVASTAGSFSNVAIVTQGLTDDGSVAFVEQSGSYAVSDIDQLGGAGGFGGNFAEVIQSGDGLGPNSILSIVQQDGASNAAQITQASAYADSVVSQFGNGHIATVAQ